MTDSTKAGMFLIAVTVTWVCFSVLILHFSGGQGITGSYAGIADVNPGLTMDDQQHVMIKPRGAHASKLLRTMDSVYVEQNFGDSFIAWVDRGAIPKVKTMGDVYFLGK